MKRRALLLTILLPFAAYADDVAPARPAGITTQESTIGQTVRYSDPTQYSSGKLERSPGVRVLADFRGMSIYIFDGDKTPGKSACAGECLRDWTPLAAPLMAAPKGEWSVIRRDDGSPQWAYKGRPLYTFVKDAKAGDTNGEGAGGLWHVARP
jgi:predicted lipoprotein with Yx(FWY)xxD motif